MEKTYYVLKLGSPNFALIRATGLAEAKRISEAEFGRLNIMSIKRATKGDIEFAQWVQDETERKRLRDTRE
jgi:hypothetical protein